ncbi:MAG: DUF1570 domain-containing protein [Kiritimatiellales bacterium]
MKSRVSFLLAGLIVSVLLMATSFYVGRPTRLENPVVLPPLQTIFRTVQISPHRKALVWTDEDRTVQAELNKALVAAGPVQRLIYDRAKTMDGRVVEDHPGYIVFTETFGANGEMSVTLPRERIVRIEPLNVPAPEVTLRDVRFFREFPDKQFYKKPPYTLLTEESFFAVEQIVKQQQELYTQFVDRVGALITATDRREDIQLVIFSDADEYAAYVCRSAPDIKGSVGFYNVAQDQLVVLHQRDADWAAEGRRKIAEIEEQQRGQLKTERERRRFAQWKQENEGRLRAQAVESTRRAIRHEGAHQLAFTLGVQSPFQRGRGWVSEGLATFFETDKPGGANDSRLDELKSALAGGQLVPLRLLLAMERCESARDYAEAWSLTCLLMQPEYRTGFFNYLDELRRHPAPFSGDPEDGLCRFLPFGPEELESRWRAFISKL